MNVCSVRVYFKEARAISTALADPGHGAVMQGGPAHHSDQGPRRLLAVLLGEVLGDRSEQVVQRGQSSRCLIDLQEGGGFLPGGHHRRELFTTQHVIATLETRCLSGNEACSRCGPGQIGESSCRKCCCRLEMRRKCSTPSTRSFACRRMATR